jgi:Transposase
MKERGPPLLVDSRVIIGVLTSISTKEPPVSEDYDGRQYVGMDLHRRRSVLVRMTEAGERLETVRIVNDREQLAAVMARAGEDPEGVLEATYGWYWAVDALAELGGCVHLAHPLGVKGFCYRRVKNDERDAADLADLLRMKRLPEAWIAPPATRELRGLVRHRAKLVHLRTRLRCQVPEASRGLFADRWEVDQAPRPSRNRCSPVNIGPSMGGAEGTRTPDPHTASEARSRSRWPATVRKSRKTRAAST